MSTVSSRNPSGSTNPSRNHSPSRSPTNTQTQRLINPSGSYGVGGNLSGLKSLNSGWQVWSGSHPRNTPGSSVASVHEVSPPRGDATQRGSLTEWTSLSRPATSRSWDEVHDHVRLDSATKARQAAIGQTGALSIPRIEQTLVLKNGLVSPTRPYGPGYQKSPVAATFDALQTARRSPNVDELSSAMRGMAVEDDHDLQRQAALNLQSRNHFPSSTPISYTSFPQPDYNSQYQASRESFSDSPFSYDPYRMNSDPPAYTSPSIINGTPPAIYPNLSPLDLHRRPGFLYDYLVNPRPPAPQFYYPNQGLLYGPPGPSPLGTPQMLPPGNVSSADKVELQYPTIATPMLTPMASLIPPSNANFGSMDSNPTHLAPFATPHMSQFVPMTPVYSSGVLAYPSNLRLTSIVRSNLLEEFRTRKSRKWELTDIVGHVVEFSTDQYGSRFIQTKLEGAGLEKIRGVYDEIVPTYTMKLMQDVFGNYVIQKLMDFGTQDQRTGLARIVENEIVDLSLNVYGCRVVQKVIELCTAEQQTQLVRTIEPHVLTVVKDTNGNHVIQKFVMTVPPERLSFLRAFRDAARQLAVHPYGCRVLQRCLEYLPNDYCRGMIDELHGIADNLMQDQFGNYVVQYVLQHGQPRDCVIIATQMRGLVLKMSRHKFASNVVEKVLVHADPEIRQKLVDEILDIEHGVDPVHAMMMDAYGNYVIQTALNQVEGEQKELLYTRVRSHLMSIKREPRPKIEPKHIVAIERLLFGDNCDSN